MNETLNKVKKIRKIVTIIGVIVILIAGIIGFVSLLDKLSIIDLDQYSAESLTGYNGTTAIDMTITDEEISDLLTMSDSEVWYALTGTAFSKKPTTSQISKSTMDERIKEITVPVRTAEGDSEITLKVNAALTKLFTAFYTDLYNYCPDFYVISGGSYYYRTVKNSTSGALSAHAFGAAVDINASVNPQFKKPYTKETYQLLSESDKHYAIYDDSTMVQIAKKYSLCWGGYFSSGRWDGMHFSFIGDWTRSRTLQEYSN